MSARAAAGAAKRYACVLCGKPAPATRMIYSRWTGARYCRDVEACERRAERLSR